MTTNENVNNTFAVLLAKLTMFETRLAKIEQQLGCRAVTPSCDAPVDLSGKSFKPSSMRRKRELPIELSVGESTKRQCPQIENQKRRLVFLQEATKHWIVENLDRAKDMPISDICEIVAEMHDSSDLLTHFVTKMENSQISRFVMMCVAQEERKAAAKIVGH